MSLYEQQIRIFIHLIKTQPDLFSEYRNELINLVDETPDDAKSLSGKIMKWCGKHIDIDKAFAKLRGKAREKGPGDEEVIEEIPDYPVDKQNLKNTIQQTFPD